MKYATRLLMTLALLLGGMGVAHAGSIIGVAGGPGDPGPMLGGYTMTSFALNNEVSLIPVSSLASPLGGSLSFSYSVDSYARAFLPEWSGNPPNSYSGDVYFNLNNGPLTLTLPANTAAFYLYALPNNYGYPHAITVTAQDGTSVTQIVQSGTTGAEYFGFYTSGSDRITSLTVSEPPGGFFLGEFGIAAGPIAAPEPSSLALLSMTAAVFAGCFWRRKKLAAV